MRSRAALLTMALAVGCTGEKGDAGPAGSTGSAGGDGQSVTSTILLPGDTACPSGGTQFVSASGVTQACNGNVKQLFDANGIRLGTLIGASPLWSLSTASSGGYLTNASLYNGGQVLTFQDDAGIIWNIGPGSGLRLVALMSAYFNSADCTGAPMGRNLPTTVPYAIVPGALPSGVYLAGAVVGGADPQSWAPPGSACIPSPPTVTPPSVYREITRIGDHPLPPLPAPITIAP